MSVPEKTLESERLFSDDKESESVALDDINEKDTENVSGKIPQEQLVKKEIFLEKFSIDQIIYEGDVEHLKKWHEACDNDDSFLQSALPLALERLRWPCKVNCVEYILQVYDGVHEHPQELKERIKAEIDDQLEPSSGEQRTFLNEISSNYSAGKLMKILQKHPELVQPVLNLTRNGRTPVLNACELRNVEVAKCLIQCGADVTIKDEKGETAIYIAAINGLVDVMEEIFTMWSQQVIPIESMLMDSDLYGEGHSIFFPALQSGNIKLYDMLINEEWGEEMLRTEIRHRDFHKVLCYLCEEGLNEIIKDLVRIDKTILSQFDEDGATPLVWAARKNMLDTVKFILRECNDQNDQELINVCDKSGRGIVYYSLPHSRVLEYLLSEFPESKRQTKIVSNPDKEFASTALEQAAIKGYCKSAAVLLSHGAYELFPKDQNYGDYNFFENVQSMDVGTLEVILSFLEEHVGDYWLRSLKRENSDFYPPLLAAARCGKDDLVNLLLDKGADATQISYPAKWTALHCAVESGSLSTVECLVRRRPELRKLKMGKGTTALKFAVKENKPTIVKYLLASHDGCDEKENLLVRAIYKGDNQGDLVSEIISGLPKEDIKKEMKEFDMLGLLVKMYPKAAIKLLDKCFEKTFIVGFDLLAEDDNTEITTYDFSFLTLSEEPGSSVLDAMITFKRDECLAHPVVEKFVELKWNSRTMKRWYYSNLLFYTIFLICLTTHIVLNSKDPSLAASGVLKAISVIALIINSFNIIKEIFQVKFIKPFQRYVNDVANFVEWAIYISSFVYFIPLSGKNDRQIEAGAIAVFLAWVNFAWFLKRFSPLGIYIIMASKVFVSILKVMPIIVIFIIAFGVAFLVVMSNDEGFNSFPISILTTFIMVTGEIDYRDVFLQAENTPFRLIQRLFLIWIVMTCSIVLMNLLVGLAVDDTCKIMERSEAEERLQKATAVKALEASLHSFSLQVPQIEDHYKEVNDYKFSEKVVGAHDDNDRGEENDEDKLLSRMAALELQLDNLRRLMEKMAATSHSR